MDDRQENKNVFQTTMARFIQMLMTNLEILMATFAKALCFCQLSKFFTSYLASFQNSKFFFPKFQHVKMPDTPFFFSTDGSRGSVGV